MTARQRLRRLIAVFATLAAAVTMTVAMTPSPAQAALSYQGTYYVTTIRGATQQCLTVKGGITLNEVPLVSNGCSGVEHQKWAIFFETGRNVYWLLAFAGNQGLNKCMDSPESYLRMHTYGCHGGSQQRFLLAIDTVNFQQIRTARNTSQCAGIDQIGNVVKMSCNGVVPAATWRLVPV